MNTKPAHLKEQTPRLTYQSAVMQVFLDDFNRWFSVTDISAEIVRNLPMNPTRETIRTALNQLQNLGIIIKREERRGLLKIPVPVYKYKI